MATPSTPTGALAVRQLGELYREVTRLAGAARAGQLDAKTLRERVLALLARQGQTAAKYGKAYVSEVYQPARFLMVAFADQLLERLDWPGRQTWSEQSLAHELYGTAHAATAVFERIDRLLAHPDEGHEELAKTYLFALCLGFTDPGGDPGSAARLRRRLFTAVFGRAPETGEIGRLTPEAYRHVASWGERALLPEVRRWALAAGVAALLLLALSFPVWWHATADLSALVDKALAASE